MKTLIGALACAAALAAWSVAWAGELEPGKPEETGLSPQRLERIGHVFQQEVDQGRIPGAVLLIARDDKLVYAETFGMQDKAAGKPMSNDAIFRIYSMTKPLVTVAALSLMEEGKIELTDPVSKYLPQLATLQVSIAKTDPYGKVTYTLAPAERPPTIQDLMRHTAGFAYGEITGDAQVRQAYARAGLFRPEVDYDARDLTPEEEVENLAKAPLIHQPGTTWEYGLAVDVLGRVVEKASGMRLEDFLAERLLKPLGMKDTGFYVPKEQIGRLAQPFAIDPASGNPNKVLDVSTPPKNASGGAGGVSTAMDYMRFSQMLLNGGVLDGARILSPTTVRLMTSDQLGELQHVVEPGELLLGVKGYTFGLGVAVRKSDGIAGVPGSQGDFTWAGAAGTYFWVDPRQHLAAVMMTQVPGPSRPYYRRLFRQLVYGAIVDSPNE